MPRQPKGSLPFTPTQAAYIVDRLIRDRRITVAAVRAIAADMDAEVRELERRLASLRGMEPQRSRVRSRRRAKRASSPQTMASRRIQGQYLGLVRQIPATQRGKYKKIAQADGREAAIRELRVALGK